MSLLINNDNSIYVHSKNINSLEKIIVDNNYKIVRLKNLIGWKADTSSRILYLQQGVYSENQLKQFITQYIQR